MQSSWLHWSPKLGFFRGLIAPKPCLPLKLTNKRPILKISTSPWNDSYHPKLCHLKTKNFSYRWEICATSCCRYSMHRLWDIHIWTVGWPWKWGWGHSRSLKVPPFNSLGMVSYSTSIATMAVSHTISDIHQLIGQKSANFLTPVFGPLLWVKPSELSNDPSDEKLQWWGFQVVKEFWRNV